MDGVLLGIGMFALLCVVGFSLEFVAVRDLRRRVATIEQGDRKERYMDKLAQEREARATEAPTVAKPTWFENIPGSQPEALAKPKRATPRYSTRAAVVAAAEAESRQEPAK